MTAATRFGVCAVGGRDAPAAERPLDDAVDWYARVSLGAWVPEPVALAPVVLDAPLARFAAAGGADPQGPSSRDLARQVVDRLPPACRTRLADAGGRLLIIGPRHFRPHVWAPRRGGIALGGNRWCTIYGIAPSDAPLGTVVHELGHLLLGWPDGDVSARGATDCLMAAGAVARGGAGIAPPAAPLLVDAGWRRTIPLDRALSASDLALRPDCVATMEWSGHRITTELRPGRLLAWVSTPTGHRLLSSWPTSGRERASILGTLAPALRRLRTPAADRQLSSVPAP